MNSLALIMPHIQLKSSFSIFMTGVLELQHSHQSAAKCNTAAIDTNKTCKSKKSSITRVHDSDDETDEKKQTSDSSSSSSSMSDGGQNHSPTVKMANVLVAGHSPQLSPINPQQRPPFLLLGLWSHLVGLAMEHACGLRYRP